MNVSQPCFHVQVLIESLIINCESQCCDANNLSNPSYALQKHTFCYFYFIYNCKVPCCVTIANKTLSQKAVHLLIGYTTAIWVQCTSRQWNVIEISKLQPSTARPLFGEKKPAKYLYRPQLVLGDSTTPTIHLQCVNEHGHMSLRFNPNCSLEAISLNIMK